MGQWLSSGRITSSCLKYLHASGQDRILVIHFPQALPEQIRPVRELLSRQAAPATAATLAESITRGRVDRIEEPLQTLVTLGHARDLGEGK